MAEPYFPPIGRKGLALRPLLAASRMCRPLLMSREAVRVCVPRMSGIYHMVVPHNGRWFVRYVGKSFDLRTRLRQHLARYEGAWVCWRYEEPVDDVLYAAECCAYWLYGGDSVLDNRKLIERPFASRRPPCGELACPVPRRAFAPRAF